jgi:hypothetical protein
MGADHRNKKNLLVELWREIAGEWDCRVWLAGGHPPTRARHQTGAACLSLNRQGQVAGQTKPKCVAGRAAYVSGVASIKPVVAMGLFR